MLPLSDFVGDRRGNRRWGGDAAFDAELFFDEAFDLRIERGVVAENFLGGVAALSDLGAFVAEPGAALLDDFLFKGEVEEAADGGDAFVIHDVELGFPERRGHLVFDHFDLGAAADDVAFTAFDLTDAADVHADAGEELEGAAAGSRSDRIVL